MAFFSMGTRELVSGNYLVLGVMGALVVLGALGCSGQESLVAEDGSQTAPRTIREQIEELRGTSRPVQVPVVKLRRQTVRERLSITGELTPERSTIVKPLMDGRIYFSEHLEVGDVVEEGQLLAKIDDRDIEDEITNQEQQIEIARKQVELDRDKLAQQEQQFEFDKKLVEKNFITQIEFEQSKLQVSQARIGVQSSEIKLEQEQQRLEKFKRNREKVPIVAPISGTVVLASHLKNSGTQGSELLNEEIMRLEGTLVGPGTELFGIISHEGFLARCLVNGKDKARLREGLPVEATVIAHKPIMVTGTVNKVSNLQDLNSRAYTVFIDLKGSPAEFASGLFVRANVELARRERTLAVPRDYLKERNGRDMVQVIEDGLVRDVMVTTGLREDNLVEIVEGLSEGDLVIAARELFATDQRVEPVEILLEELSTVETVDSMTGNAG